MMKIMSLPDVRKGMTYCGMSMMVATILLLNAGRITAQHGSQQLPTKALVTQANLEQSSNPASGQSAAEKYFTDVELINQNGQKMRLYSDLLKNKVVIINSFFATCPGSCLPMMRNLQKVQTALVDRVGKDLFIVSISVDSTVDTPLSLRNYAKKISAGPGWYFLTGEKTNVDSALRKLGQHVDNKEAHTNIFIIGNERTGLWKKAFGLANSEELIKVVESVLNDKGTGGN